MGQDRGEAILGEKNARSKRSALCDIPEPLTKRCRRYQQHGEGNQTSLALDENDPEISKEGEDC